MSEPYRLTLRPRVHETDGSRTIGFVHLLHLAEEARGRFFEDLLARGTPRLAQTLARVQRVVVHAPLPSDAELRAEVALARVGGTSFDVVTRFAATTGSPLASVAITFVAADGHGRKVPVPDALRALVREMPVEALEEPHAIERAAFVRELFVLPSDENRGPHMSHAHLLRTLDDHRRLAALRGAFAEASPRLVRPARRATALYDREAHFGDELRLRLGLVREGVVDGVLEDAATGATVVRARLEAS